MKSNHIILFIALFVFSHSVFAKEFPVAVRLFVGSLNAEPSDLNQEMTAQNLKKIDSVGAHGVEVVHKAHKYFEWGFRYTKRFVRNEEDPESSSTDYYGQLDQDSVLILARVPFFKSDILRADVFGGVGGSNTEFKFKTSSLNGELSKSESDDWYASAYTNAGASIAVGYKNYFFVVEGGYESNKVDGFKRTGTTNENVKNINLTGSYISIGLLIDGLTGTDK